MAEPKRLEKSSIKKMIELRKMGYTFKDIGTKFGVTESTVRYHLNPHFKSIVKRSVKKQKQEPEYKKKTNERYKKRYHTEPEFRKRHIERSKRYQKEHPDKKRQYYLERKRSKAVPQNPFNINNSKKTKKGELKTLIVGLCVLLIITIIVVYIAKAMLGG